MSRHVEVIVRTPEALAEWLVADLAREIRAAAAARGRFALAVPGGSVAEAFFPHLGAAALDWGAVHLFWTDERAAPPGSPDSNHEVARRLWLAQAAIPPANLHPMPAERPDLDAAAREHASELAAVAGSPPLLDYVLLGVGADGHVASLFPGVVPRGGADSVQWTDASPKPPARRMTLAMETLARARRLVVAALDASKRDVMHAALDDPAASTPVAVVLREARRPVVLLAPGAAP